MTTSSIASGVSSTVAFDTAAARATRAASDARRAGWMSLTAVASVVVVTAVLALSWPHGVSPVMSTGMISVVLVWAVLDAERRAGRTWGHVGRALDAARENPAALDAAEVCSEVVAEALPGAPGIPPAQVRAYAERAGIA